MADDFRRIRDERIRSIANEAERGGVPRDEAVRIAEQRMERAMPRIVRTREDEGKSRPIELNSK